MVSQLIISLVLLIIGIQLIRGKLLIVVGPYNTSSKMNWRNLGKLIGSLALFCSFAIIVTIIAPQATKIVTILIPILALLSFLFAITSRLFKD